MKPYYEDSAVKIYHGDCKDLDFTAHFDLLLTDPPYGINENWYKARSKTRNGVLKDYGKWEWDKEPIDWNLMVFLLKRADKQIVFGGNYYPMPPSSCWLVWDKLNSGDFADCELAWTNLKKAVRIKRHMWNGMLRKDQEPRFHPTQKPLDVMQWCILQAGDGVETILDPFAGSGTTGLAAKNLGRKATLVEQDERYCEIAAKRMSQEVLAL